jgi:hypothetical protein
MGGITACISTASDHLRRFIFALNDTMACESVFWLAHAIDLTVSATCLPFSKEKLHRYLL